MIVNATPMPAAYTLGLAPDGREYCVVVVKGTFGIPAADGVPQLAEAQPEAVMADEFYGEPGYSATKRECDFALVKPRCDVVLLGSAHALPGQLAKRVTVSMRVGPMAKTFDVVGDRKWDKALLSLVPTEPVPFTKKPIHFGLAYGGTDTDPANPDKTDTFRDNPIGTGYYPRSPSSKIVGRPLPSTEPTGKPINAYRGQFPAVSFSPLSRNVPERIRHAGTYDQKWQDNVFPFLPGDFNPLYFQCAPIDQRIDHPKGGETVELLNLTPRSREFFRLPPLDLPVEFTDAAYTRTQVQADADTLILEPDAGTFSVVWRARCPLKRNLLEMRQIVVGRPSRAWYRARDLGKTYYSSLKALVAAGADDSGSEDA